MNSERVEQQPGTVEQQPGYHLKVEQVEQVEQREQTDLHLREGEVGPLVRMGMEQVTGREAGLVEELEKVTVEE